MLYHRLKLSALADAFPTGRVIFGRMSWLHAVNVITIPPVIEEGNNQTEAERNLLSVTNC
jgi:hypothetical protein